NNVRVRRIDSRGLITTVGGGGNLGSLVEGISALQATIPNPEGIAVAADGTIYVGQSFGAVVRRIGTTGIISSVTNNIFFSIADPPDGAPAASFYLGATGLFFVGGQIALGPDGLYLVEYADRRIARLHVPAAGFGDASVTVSSPDGMELYVFDANG